MHFQTRNYPDNSHSQRSQGGGGWGGSPTAPLNVALQIALVVIIINLFSTFLILHTNSLGLMLVGTDMLHEQDITYK